MPALTATFSPHSTRMTSGFTGFRTSSAAGSSASSSVTLLSNNGVANNRVPRGWTRLVSKQNGGKENATLTNKGQSRSLSSIPALALGRDAFDVAKQEDFDALDVDSGEEVAGNAGMPPETATYSSYALPLLAFWDRHKLLVLGMTSVVLLVVL